MNKETMKKYNKIFSNIRRKTFKDRFKERIELLGYKVAIFLIYKANVNIVIPIHR